MKKAVLILETLACPACLQKIESAIKSFEAVDKDSIKVLFNASKAKFTFDEQALSIEDVQAKIAELGYEILQTKVSDA